MSRATKEPVIPAAMPCPACRARVARAGRDANGQLACPRCGTRLQHAVPVFAPPMGGPAWWYWRRAR